MWRCRCTCGRETDVDGGSLATGNTSGCSRCWRVTHEIGNRYGRLTVIGSIDAPRGRGAWWLCKCDCGNQTRAQGASLRYGSTKSCGCVGIEKLRERVQLPTGEGARRHILRVTKRQAELRGYCFELSEEQTLALMQRPCAYCGAPPSNLCDSDGINGAFSYNGIDRVDNAIGYTTENTVPCCKHCNYAKRDRTVSEFAEWSRRVADRLGK